MAIIKPFRGLRYNQDIIPDISSVVTPPYDVITDEKREQYYQMHPYNIIRLDFGKDLPGDNEQNNKYTRAAKLLKSWRETGILSQEDTPSIYIYDQEFSCGNRQLTRRGFIVLVRLELFESGYIYPHEQTLPGPKEDRLKLTKWCRANLSSIFALFPDEGGKVDTYLSSATPTKPDVEFIDDSNVTNRLWVIKEGHIIDTLVSTMKEKPLFIADGHHRYETSLLYRDQIRKERGDLPADLPVDYVMMVCVSMNNPGLQILPVHRVVKNVREGQYSTIIKSLKEMFDVECLSSGGNNNVDRYLPAFYNESHNHIFLMYMGREDSYYRLQLRNESLVESIFDKEPPEWKHLDAGILHSIILKNILGIDTTDGNEKNHVKYIKNEAEAITRVQSGEYQLAFFMRPTLIEQVREIAIARKVMPPKSTYFYPKVITGVVINSFDG